MFHCHTEYSLLDSCDKVQAYIDLAVRDGANAISFSEHGKMLNWTENGTPVKKPAYAIYIQWKSISQKHLMKRFAIITTRF